MDGDLAAQLGLFLETSGLPAIFVILLLKEMGVPIPLPGDFVMLFAGVQAARGMFDPWLALLALVAAAMLGSTLVYMLAGGPGRSVIYRFGRFVGLTPARLDMAARAVQRRGVAAVLVGRCTPGLGMPTAAAAGISNLGLRLYLGAALVAAVVFAGGHVLLGYLAGPLVLDMFESLHLPILPIVAGLILIGLAVWVLRRALRGRARQHAVADGIGAWAHAACPACLLVAGLGERVMEGPSKLIASEASR